MKVTREQVKALADAVDLGIPEKDLDNVTIRFASLLAAMQGIEAELGEQMDSIEPLPPVFWREDFE